MKILWVKSDFLHPTTKGGHIRTLEMLRRMRERHEIHYVACHDGRTEESLRRSGEYCFRAYPVRFELSAKGSPQFLWEAGTNLFSPLPVHMVRLRSAAMRRQVEALARRERFDAMVCDFLTPAINLPELERWVLFQHNIETMIWRRRAQNAGDPLRRWYLRTQAGRLFRYERAVCRAVRHVIAVSDADAQAMRDMFGATRVSAIPTGVDVEHFTPPERAEASADLVFVGSMDWSPNVDGMLYFADQILPRIRGRKPDCAVSVVGRDPVRSIRELGERDPLIRVHGTVPDVRPYLWSARVSIVPLRIGGGTRLKIYESMAAQVPIVSTPIGAEGLLSRHGENIYLAATPVDFAARCLELLESPEKRERMARTAWELVRERFSWEQVAREFEGILERSQRSSAQ
jgi:glycosyltransferase involved in cell wall biosynthesis